MLLIPIGFQFTTNVGWWQGTALLFPSESLELHHSLLGSLSYIPIGLLSVIPEGEPMWSQRFRLLANRLDTFPIIDDHCWLESLLQIPDFVGQIQLFIPKKTTLYWLNPNSCWSSPHFCWYGFIYHFIHTADWKAMSPVKKALTGLN